MKLPKGISKLFENHTNRMRAYNDHVKCLYTRAFLGKHTSFMVTALFNYKEAQRVAKTSDCDRNVTKLCPRSPQSLIDLGMNSLFLWKLLQLY